MAEIATSGALEAQNPNKAVCVVHTAQLVTYLQLSGYPAGLLINFNVTKLVNGVRRVLNDEPRIPPSGPEPT